MAYNVQYQSIFHNELEQEVTISLLQKDSAETTPLPFITSELELNDSTEENTIIAREATFEIWADDDTAITWETFLAGSYDEWMVTVSIDGQSHFIGFLTPDEGSSPFLPKPYVVKLRATNSLKLLKEVALTDLDGNNFHGKFTAIEYLVAALQKTLLSLNIRIYGSIYNVDMDNRGDNPAADYLSQIKFDHRTFMKDATTFKDCYEVLTDLLDRHSKLFFYNGMWVIFYKPEHQYTPGGLWYTDYDPEGTVITGGQDTEGVSAVGSTQLIYPQDEDQLLSSSFPIKYAKTIFNYNIWPEIPLNSKFQRGTQVGSGTDADGNQYQDYSIDDWTSGTYQGNPTEFNNLPAFTVANPDSWVRRSTFNAFGIEIKREVIIERATAAGARFVQSEGIPVNQGDKARFSFDWKTSVDLSAVSAVPVQLIPYIKDDITGTKYVLRSKDGQVSEAKWEPAGTSMIGIYTTPNGDLLEYQSISVDSPAFPVNGSLYIILLSSAQLGDNSFTFYKGFSMEYIPYVAGGFIPIKGDYWQHSQTAGQIDKDEGEIKTSDTITRVLQGCMFKMDGVAATDASWYRYGITEQRHFKELVNIGRYNLGYRRFWRIEGSFTGLQYSTIDNPLIQNPLSYHKNYRFTDLPEPRDFILVPPLRMDLCTGVIKAIFEEVYNPALTTNHGAEMYRVIQGLQASVALLGVLYTLERYPPDPRMMKLISPSGDMVTDIIADDGGAGNAPSLIVNTQSTEGSTNVAIMTIGEDLAIGNSFYFKVGGQDVFYTVVDIIEQSDGTQTGDTQEFNYIFSN